MYQTESIRKTPVEPTRVAPSKQQELQVAPIAVSLDEFEKLIAINSDLVSRFQNLVTCFTPKCTDIPSNPGRDLAMQTINGRLEYLNNCMEYQNNRLEVLVNSLGEVL